MPIRPENRSRYPADWPRIRAAILERASKGTGHPKCERCGVPQYAVGYRDADGAFVPGCGNGPWDAAGQGCDWPSYAPITYEDARFFADGANESGEHARHIVIVLTIAHLADPDPANCDPANLAALCQRCHNRHDAAMRARNAAETRQAKRGADLFSGAGA